MQLHLGQKKLLNINNEAGKLAEDQRNQFHTFVMKSMFLSKIGRPDISPAISFLCTRVRNPVVDDWSKLTKMMIFSKKTKADWKLTIHRTPIGLLTHYTQLTKICVVTQGYA